MNANRVKLMPTTYLLISVVAIVALHVLRPVAKVVPTPWNLLGILPLAVGVVINLVADRAFHAAQTTVRPFEKSSALVTSGVFPGVAKPDVPRIRASLARTGRAAAVANAVPRPRGLCRAVEPTVRCG
jgi:hypothetical protein